MSVIGEQIKKYRIHNKYTQKDLGSKIGVTTQAVSKWECGGTPDAEVLPVLADALGVSIDALYGREDQDLQLLLTKKLSTMPSEEAFHYAFNYCWSLIPGLTGDESFSENLYDAFTGHPDKQTDQDSDFLAKILREDGLTMARMSNDFRYFFLMVRPHDKGIQTYFESAEAIRQIFALFADKKILKTLYYLYTVSNIPVTAQLISQGTGLELSEVERCVNNPPLKLIFNQF